MVNLLVNHLFKYRRVARDTNPRLKLTLTELSRPINQMVRSFANMADDLS